MKNEKWNFLFLIKIPFHPWLIVSKLFPAGCDWDSEQLTCVSQDSRVCLIIQPCHYLLSLSRSCDKVDSRELLGYLETSLLLVVLWKKNTPSSKHWNKTDLDSLEIVSLTARPIFKRARLFIFSNLNHDNMLGSEIALLEQPAWFLLCFFAFRTLFHDRLFFGYETSVFFLVVQ